MQRVKSHSTSKVSFDLLGLVAVFAFVLAVLVL